MMQQNNLNMITYNPGIFAIKMPGLFLPEGGDTP